MTTLVLEALARAGWPAAQVFSLVAGDDELTFRLRLGAPPPADLDPLLTALEDDLDALVALRPGARDELLLTLRELSPRQAWRALSRLPSYAGVLLRSPVRERRAGERAPVGLNGEE